jgi:hypothetical protein
MGLGDLGPFPIAVIKSINIKLMNVTNRRRLGTFIEWNEPFKTIWDLDLIHEAAEAKEE